MDDRRASPRPDLDCVRGLVPSALLAAAVRRAHDIGVGVHRVLAVCGVMSEEHYLRAFAARLGVPFESLAETPREACPFDDDPMINAVVAGALPLTAGDSIVYAVAPRALTSPGMHAYLRRSPDYPRCIRITCDSCLAAYVARHAGNAVAERAANALARRFPELSAAATRRRAATTILASSTAMAVGAGLWPQVVHLAVGSVFAIAFLAWSTLRLWSALQAPAHYRPSRRLADAELPLYTVIAALHDEVDAVGGLVAAIDRLDYPPEKLDIKLVLEPDDVATRKAVARLDLRAPYEIVVAPACHPRTKPKALNAALPFARGEFIAIFDAEDKPETDQLRAAVACFRAHGPELACAQARLTIGNTCDSWLTRLFTTEYAGLFDVFLPGLAQYRLPLPLGGSSNHFAVSALREVGGWDAHNVTEDADLGMRLARFGYVTAVLESSTWEEAPSSVHPWLRQRTRWFKGWAQTWLVHMRRPVRLWHELGAAGFIVFQLVVGGSVLAALVHPVFIGIFIAGIIIGGMPDFVVMYNHYGAALVTGYASSITLGLVGLARRRLLSQAWVLALIPFYWILLSIAAWRAIYKLLAQPFEWEKTAHGLARTWRRPSEMEIA
jgi:glycosyltransferase XagB